MNDYYYWGLYYKESDFGAVAAVCAAGDEVLSILVDLAGVLVAFRAVDDGVAETPAEGAARGSLLLLLWPGVGVWVVDDLEDRRDALLGFDEQKLQVEQGGLLAHAVDEGRRDARLAAAARAADAVDVLFDLRREVEVDDVLDFRKVESFRCDVRRDEDVLVAALEGGDGMVPLGLVLAAVDRHGVDAFEEEVLVDVVDVVLLLAENHHRRRGLLEAFQHVDDAGLGLDVLDFLDDVEVRRAGP
mmetsp:Transcript_10582/g.34967  ORF Transcript_10582/g.34967 Transcript_10582/m.34967 type:complete len:244 (+) Transcript_10582:1622-2353(+)